MIAAAVVDLWPPPETPIAKVTAPWAPRTRLATGVRRAALVSAMIARKTKVATLSSHSHECGEIGKAARRAWDAA